jgi:hypothetical protein
MTLLEDLKHFRAGRSRLPATVAAALPFLLLALCLILERLGAFA